MLIDYHRTMLADRVRNEAFHEALKQVVVAGKTTVADIGSGTGVLGFLASRLGARAVHLFEQADVMELAVKLARLNKVRNCHFYHDHSTNILDLEPVDVIVSETLGNFAYEENIIETLNDALRFLKPGGIVIPRRITQLVAPVVNDRFHRELIVWDETDLGLDFGPAKEMTFHNMYVRSILPSDLLDAPDAVQSWDNVELGRKNKSVRQGEVRWTAEKQETIYGFALWWECELVEGVHLATAPDAPRTHWEQLYLPLQHPLEVTPGDEVMLRLHSDTRYEVGVNVRWQVNHKSGGETRTQAYDIRKGYLG